MKKLIVACAFTAALAVAMSDPAAAQGPQDGLRYDSPTTSGFVFSPMVAPIFGQSTSQDYWGTMLRYAGEFSGFRIAAGVGYERTSGRTIYEGTGFSTSGTTSGGCVDAYFDKPWLLHVPTGLFVRSGFGASFCNGITYGAVNPMNGLEHFTRISAYETLGTHTSLTKNWLIQGGVSQNWFGVRSTSIYSESGLAFGQVQINVPGLPGANESRIGYFWGLGVAAQVPIWGMGTVQSIDAAAMELYLGYRQVNLGNTDANLGGNIRTHNEIHVVTSGARIKF